MPTTLAPTLSSASTVPDSPARAALAAALAALDRVESRGEPSVIAHSLGDVAQCYALLGMHAHRRWYLQQALRFASILGAVDASVDILCQLAEAHVEACKDGADRAALDDDDDPRRAHSARDQARDSIFEATRLVHRSADPQWEVTVLLRVSDLLDRIGDHDDAIALQRRALTLIAQGAVQCADAPRG